MSNKDRTKYNEYMRKYMLARYRNRMRQALSFLGDKCSWCGGKEDLELDHTDRAEKGFTIGHLWSVSLARFWEEVKKCQILCSECHNKKTLKELGFEDAKNSHGTISSYRYCKCSLCKNAMKNYMKEYYKTRKRITINGRRLVEKI